MVEPKLMDGWVRGIAATFRELSLDFRFVQTGFVRDYAALMLGASAVFVIYMVVVLAK